MAPRLHVHREVFRTVGRDTSRLAESWRLLRRRRRATARTARQRVHAGRHHTRAVLRAGVSTTRRETADASRCARPLSVVTARHARAIAEWRRRIRREAIGPGVGAIVREGRSGIRILVRAARLTGCAAWDALAVGAAHEVSASALSGSDRRCRAPYDGQITHRETGEQPGRSHVPTPQMLAEWHMAQRTSKRGS